MFRNKNICEIFRELDNFLDFETKNAAITNLTAQTASIDFLLGGCSAVMACCFTNPIDLIKTRKQLHGELVKSGFEGPNSYSTLIKSVKTIVQSEGLWGLQRGLGPALGFQFFLNSIRLGLYDIGEKHGLLRDENNELRPVVSVVWGGISGMIGASMGVPFYMVKTQLQSTAPGKFGVGHQHGHSGTINAFKTTWRKGGVRGLFHGLSGMLPRTAVGSAVQLTAFARSKDFLNDLEMLRGSFYITTIGASFISGGCLCLSMTPLDVVCTRLMNQNVDAKGRGILYSGVIDCLVKTFRTEGFFGLYKGVSANFFRQAPHTVLNLTFWDMLKGFREKYYNI